MRKVKINGVYKHFKGDLYIVEDIGYDSETCDKVVIYRALYGEHKLWVRPYSSFIEEVNKNKCKYRFTEIKMNSVRKEN